MTEIRHMFSEVQFELVKIILLNVFLSTVIVFLAADLVALMFSMPLWYVIVVSLIYFVVILSSEIRKISVKEVERRNPELKEMLRTAKDNVSDDSLMAQALFLEVLQKMRRVSSGTFIDFKKLMAKLSVIFAFAIVLVSIAFFNVNISQFENPLARPLSLISGFFGNPGPVEGYQADAATDDLFGEAKMAKLGNDQLAATVNPSLDNPDFNNVDPASPTQDPLSDLAEGDAGFNAGGAGFTQEGIDQRDLQRSYEYAKATQG